MSPRKLSPALLAALGLTACTDGDASDLPIIGHLFDDGGDDDGVGPCLEVMPCLSPPARDTGVGVCLKVAPAQPITKPIHVGPCLKIRPPVPSPTAPVGPCLEMPPVPQPRVGPCLKPLQPPPPKKPQVGPCLTPRRPSVQPCLDFAEPAPPPQPPDPADQGGGIQRDRVEVLAALVESGALAADVLDRIDDGSG